VAKIEDLVKRISDEKLRDEIAAEVRELKKHKQFGLVFYFSYGKHHSCINAPPPELPEGIKLTR
jgi:hypothetical protein